MCINKIIYSIFYKKHYNKETQTPKITSYTSSIQTENNINTSISQTDLNMENLMDFSNEDWYKLVWTNPTWDKNQLIDFKY